VNRVNKREAFDIGFADGVCAFNFVVDFFPVRLAVSLRGP
jgi:hypothetical protein